MIDHADKKYLREVKRLYRCHMFVAVVAVATIGWVLYGLS